MKPSTQESKAGPATAHIALCCNGAMLPGLHATLASLVKNLGQRDQVSLTLFIQDISEKEQATIRGTVAQAGGVGDFSIREADISEFKGLKALHGDWMTYLRLFLPKLIPEADTLLYLDSDLIVNTDASAFFHHDLHAFPLGAVPAETVEWSLDRDLLKSVGLTDQDQCFNAGALIINSRLWRDQGLIERCLEFGRAHASFLRAADQTILNGLFSRDFYGLPMQLNTAVFAYQKPFELADGIYHFIGSPKPSDPFGKLFHGNWRIWHDVIRQTQFTWSDFLSQHMIAYGKRAWTLRRSYMRNWLRKRKT